MSSRGALLALFVMAAGCDQVFGVHGATDGGAIGDAEPDAPRDGGPAARCSPMTIFGDTFDTNKLKTQWPSSYVKDGSFDSLDVVDGRLLFHALSNGGFVIMDTPFYFDFRDQMFSLKFQDNGGAQFDVAATFRVILDSPYVIGNGHNRELVITRVADRLSAEAINDNGTPQTIGTKTYNPVEDAYAQVGIRGSLAVFEVSPDGANWTTLGSVAYDHMDLVHPRMELHHSVGDWEVAVDELLGGTPVGVTCDIDSLQDTFEAPPLAPTWAGSTAGNVSTLSVDGGQLHIHTDDASQTAAQTYLRAAVPYDVRAGALFFKIPQLFLDDQDKTLQLVVDGFVHNISMVTTNGTLAISYFQNGTTTSVFNQSYDRADRWWKIQHTGNTTSFLLSKNGTTYRTLASTPSIDSFSAAQIYIRAASKSAIADDLRLDNFNTAP
ncbi:hypothetical protein BH11MYX2_BH11MYX2_11420 [soil metagenome]